MISRRTLMRGLALLPAARWSWLGAVARSEERMPLLGEGTMMGGRGDLARPELRPLIGRLLGTLQPDRAGDALAPAVIEAVAALRQAGAAELLWLIDLDDFPGPPLLAVPLRAGADPVRIGAILAAGLPEIRIPGAVSQVARGHVVVGLPGAVERLRANPPAGRPDLEAALAAGPPASLIRVAVSAGRAFRRATEESLAALPTELGGGPVAALTQGARWAALGIPADAEPARLVVQATDPRAAAALARIMQGGLDAAGAALNARADARDLAARLKEIRPEATEDRVVATVAPEVVVGLVAIPLRQFGEAWAHTQSVTNLKQVGLAMHNYHSAHGTFPPTYRASSAGEPLLSWRVLVLPYLEQQKLFDQFHLDEPWDSPHNRALIPQMPRVYAAPSASPMLATAGKTVYLTPRGEATMFPGGTPVAFKDITDGTSNTIMTIEVDDEHAATWTKPDDWDITLGRPGHGRPLIVGIADGSVRTFAADVKPAALQPMFTRGGGEVINWDEV